jgi:hypothetical protein
MVGAEAGTRGRSIDRLRRRGTVAGRLREGFFTEDADAERVLAAVFAGVVTTGAAVGCAA